jgi:PAS domain S-box-containing protein
MTIPEQQEDELWMARISLDRSSDSIHWISPDARIIYVNDAMCNLLGYSREELLSLRILDIDPNTSTEAAWQEAWKIVVQQGSLSLETTHRCKDGRIIPIEVTGDYIQYQGKEYVCAFGRDITERKQAEAERDVLQQQVIEAQRAAIRELSTPLLPLSDQVIAMPLVGSVDSQRAQDVMETLLEGIATHGADTAMLDITGVQVMDTQVANVLVQAARASRLLGARVIITGIGPAMAQTLVHLEADLSDMITLSTFQAGIAYVLNNNV